MKKIKKIFSQNTKNMAIYQQQKLDIFKEILNSISVPKTNMKIQAQIQIRSNQRILQINIKPNLILKILNIISK